jgi:D-alanine-D-alanine ligase
MSAKAAGISYEDLCLRLLASAALDHARPSKAAADTASDASRRGEGA